MKHRFALLVLLTKAATISDCCVRVEYHMAPRARSNKTGSKNKKGSKSNHKSRSQSSTSASHQTSIPLSNTSTSHHNHENSDDDDRTEEWNFVREAGPGCHIARKKEQHSSSSTADRDSGWVLEWESVHPSDFEDESVVPDVAIDPDEQTLSLCNLRNDPVVAYITVYDNLLIGRNGKALQQGSTTDKDGTSKSCTTLIVLCPPTTFAHLCRIDLESTSQTLATPSSRLLLDQLHIDSDVQVWNRHENPNDEHEHSIGFPLQGGGPFLCTQGEGGHLTHFLAGNQHAIDFQCPKGTPLLAVGDGLVVQTQDEHQQLTGIAVSNLFSWNSILLQLDPPPTSSSSSSSSSSTCATPKETKDSVGDDNTASVSETTDPLFVEYVHIASSQVQVGDRVVKGQVIGTSGGIGFSPEDHLHFAGYRSAAADAPTVRLRFEKAKSDINNNMANSSCRQDDGSQIFYPRAGRLYDCHGEIVDKGFKDNDSKCS
ncbi:hypothetical protein ACA910_002334 [Epithemia clementina (nom. ined.)]